METLHEVTAELEEAAVKLLFTPDSAFAELSLFGDGAIRLTVSGFADSTEPHCRID